MNKKQNKYTKNLSGKEYMAYMQVLVNWSVINAVEKSDMSNLHTTAHKTSVIHVIKLGEREKEGKERCRTHDTYGRKKGLVITRATWHAREHKRNSML